MKPHARRTYEAFDIHSLESQELLSLFAHARSYIQQIKIEMFHERRKDGNEETHPALTVGVDLNKPTIRFVDALDREARIEAIAHELGHLTLMYRFGLGILVRRCPRPGNGEGVFRYFMNSRRDWFYLLSQIGNTTHHLFLVDYLKAEYGIESKIHPRLLHRNLSILVNDVSCDTESLYARGLMVFEYERLIGDIDRLVNLDRQSELIQQAYGSAARHFGRYLFPNIPDPSSHEENIFSFLQDLAYEREDFSFFPSEKASWS